MWKMVLNDLRYGIKPGLKRVFARFMNYYIYLYLLFFAPVILQLEGKHLLVYYLAIVPFILSMMLFIMYGGTANKALYLCPLSKAQRRQYFLISWGVRAGLPPLFSVLFEGALCISGQISFLSALMIVLSTVFFSLPLNLYGNAGESGQTDKRFAHYNIWYVAVQFLGIITIIFLAGILGDIEKPRFTGGEAAAAAILFFAQVLTALTMFVKYFQLTIDRMTCYEKCES